MKRNFVTIRAELDKSYNRIFVNDDLWNDGEDIVDWAKRNEWTREPLMIGACNNWSNSDGKYLQVGEKLIFSQSYSVLTLTRGNINNTWAKQTFLFIPNNYFSDIPIYFVSLRTADVAGEVKHVEIIEIPLSEE